MKNKRQLLSIVMIIMISVTIMGCVDDDPESNEKSSIPPIARYEYTPKTVWRNLTVTLNSTSFDADGTITNYTWDLGDGTILFGNTVSYRYETPGVYTVSLTVEDDELLIDTKEKTIIIYTYPTLENISLSLKDLPQGYTLLESSYNTTYGINLTLPAYEVFNNKFIYFDPENNTGYPLIVTSYCRMNSSDDADTILQRSADQMYNSFSPFLEDKTGSSLETVGDQTIYRLFQGSINEEDLEYQDLSWSYLYFQVDTIIVLVLLDEVPSSSIDYQQQTYRYARIIEENINTYFFQD